METLPNKPRRLTRRSRWIQKIYRKLHGLPLFPSSHPYNLTISHSHKFIWYRVAKAGTRTILNHLHSNNIHLDIEEAGFIYYEPRRYPDYFKFAIVRNPWDRLISCWLNKVLYSNSFSFNPEDLEKYREFSNFLNFVSSLDLRDCDRHLQLQSTLIDLNHVNYIGRLETFDTDLKYIFTRIGIKSTEIQPMNVTPNRDPYRSYYTPEKAQQVAELYRLDIQIFGYKFD